MWYWNVESDFTQEIEFGWKNIILDTCNIQSRISDNLT